VVDDITCVLAYFYDCHPKTGFVKPTVAAVPAVAAAPAVPAPAAAAPAVPKPVAAATK
jgi:hypothetical protein